MQSLIRSKSAGVTGGRGTAGAGPGRDLSIRAEIRNLAVLHNNPKPARVSEILADLDH